MSVCADFRWHICLGLATVVACRPAPTDASENIPFKIIAIAGSNQSAPVNTELPDEISFLVTDGSGNPVSGVHVTLDVGEDEGGTPAKEKITEANGTITTNWALGPQSGTQSLVAHVAHLDSAMVVATATGCDLPECPEYELTEDQEIDVFLPTNEVTGQVVHPDVVRRTSSRGQRLYWLAITPYPNGNALFENPSIYRGGNGRYWRVPKGLVNPVVRVTTGYNSDPDIIVDKATNDLWMYYRIVTTEQNIIMLTRSSDGVTWSKSETMFSVPNHSAVSPAIVNEGPHAPLQMWTVNAGAAGCVATSSVIERRTSTDGIKWSAPKATNLQQPGRVIWHLDVRWVASRSEYWALYTTYMPGLNCATTGLWLARSQDGISWTIPKSPVYYAGANPFFKDVVYRSSFLTSDDGSTTTLWLSGANFDGANLIWGAAVARRRTDDLIAASDAAISTAARDLNDRLLPIPEPWDMPSSWLWGNHR